MPLRSARQLSLAILTLSFTIFWVLNLFVHNSVGVDYDQVVNTRVIVRHYRIRWPGDGSFQAGLIQHHYLDDSIALEGLDLAQGLFEPKLRRPPQSVWNRLGFWWIADEYWHIRQQSWTSEYWAGIPAWLPVVLFGSAWWVLNKKASP